MRNGQVAATIFVSIFLAPAGAGAQESTASMLDVSAPYGVAPVDDKHIFYHAILDEFEGRFGRNGSFRWAGEAWAGTDMDRAFLKSEGELTNGRIEDGQQELLYARSISTYFNLQAGARYDLDSNLGRAWAAFGVEGLAPLFFHVSATGYASDDGRLAARLQGSYDLLLTQTLILQPQAELNFYSKADPARQIGSGLSDIDLGLRLRYELSRKFAPYVGITYENKFGAAGNLPASGDQRSDLRFTLGVRAWL